MKLEIIEYSANAGLGVVFPAKTFVIETNNEFVIISHSSLNKEKIQVLKETQKKIYFISPNNLHNLYLKKMYDLFPQAEFYGPKRSAKQSGVELKNLNTLELEEIQIIPLKGHNALSESCFYLKELETLIVTDLFFNMHHQMNFATKLAMCVAGTYHKLGTSRMLKLSIKDKEAFISSLKGVDILSPKVVIPNHGDKISGKAFRAYLQQWPGIC